MKNKNISIIYIMSKKSKSWKSKKSWKPVEKKVYSYILEGDVNEEWHEGRYLSLNHYGAAKKIASKICTVPGKNFIFKVIEKTRNSTNKIKTYEGIKKK
jgi:hypothetical protein